MESIYGGSALHSWSTESPNTTIILQSSLHGSAFTRTKLLFTPTNLHVTFQTFTHTTFLPGRLTRNVYYSLLMMILEPQNAFLYRRRCFCRHSCELRCCVGCPLTSPSSISHSITVSQPLQLSTLAPPTSSSLALRINTWLLPPPANLPSSLINISRNSLTRGVGSLPSFPPPAPIIPRPKEGSSWHTTTSLAPD